MFIGSHKIPIKTNKHTDNEPRWYTANEEFRFVFTALKCKCSLNKTIRWKPTREQRKKDCDVIVLNLYIYIEWCVITIIIILLVIEIWWKWNLLTCDRERERLFCRIYSWDSAHETIMCCIAYHSNLFCLGYWRFTVECIQRQHLNLRFWQNKYTQKRM